MFVSLQVKYAPKVMISVIGESALTGGRIPEGTDIRFLCRADANPPNVTYRWYINDELVAGDYTTEMVSLFMSVCSIYILYINRKHCAQCINMSLCIVENEYAICESQRFKMFINYVRF